MNKRLLNCIAGFTLSHNYKTLIIGTRDAESLIVWLKQFEFEIKDKKVKIRKGKTK